MTYQHMYLAAVNFTSLTDKAGTELYGGQNSGAANFFTLLGMLISILISILGIILLFFIVTAGFYWFTAAGDVKQIEKAKRLLYNSVIGIVLILTAYSMSIFVQRALIDRLASPPATTQTTTQSPTQ